MLAFSGRLIGRRISKSGVKLISSTRLSEKVLLWNPVYLIHPTWQLMVGTSRGEIDTFVLTYFWSPASHNQHWIVVLITKWSWRSTLLWGLSRLVDREKIIRKRPAFDSLTTQLSMKGKSQSKARVGTTHNAWRWSLPNQNLEVLWSRTSHDSRYRSQKILTWSWRELGCNIGPGWVLKYAAQSRYTARRLGY